VLITGYIVNPDAAALGFELTSAAAKESTGKNYTKTGGGNNLAYGGK
jgi:hypothetical protein